MIPEHYRLFAGLEGYAAGEFGYEPMVIPGLLQTADYSAGLVGADQVSPLHYDRVIEFRQVRQQRVLAERDPLRLEVVIEEDALIRPVLDPPGMHSQLERLLDLADRDNVTVQVMPRAVAVHDGVVGSFNLLDFAATQSVGYVPYPDGSVYVPEYHDVAGYQYRKSRLQADALSEAESREVIAARRTAWE